MTKDTGGPANPVFIVASSISREELVNLREVLNKTPGLTVRDHFAGEAMKLLDPSNGMDWCSERAYAYADAMLRARAQ